jgi:hypothetical protein
VSYITITYLGILTQKVGTEVNYSGIFVTLALGIIKYHCILTLGKEDTMVNYCCKFNCGMAVTYHGLKFYNIGQWWQT